MKGRRIKNWQPILVVSPYPLNLPPVPQIATDGHYRVVEVFTTTRALSVIKDELPAIIIVNAFLDKFIRSTQECSNLINRARETEFQPLIIATATVDVQPRWQDNILCSGANIFVPAGLLEQRNNLQNFIQSYEKIMLCDRGFMRNHRGQEICEEIKLAVLHINQGYLKRYFLSNPGKRTIKIDPWRINRSAPCDKHKSPDDCGPDSFCFEFTRNEVLKYQKN